MAATRERLRDLWRTRRGNVAVEDVDVAPSGTAAVCLRERPDRRSNAWRVRVVRRSAAGAWSGPVLVAAPRRFLDDVECAVDDAGGVVLAWHEAMGPGVLRASAVSAAGAVAPAVTLGQGPEEPRVEMAPDGTAVVAFIAHEPDGGRCAWPSTRARGPRRRAWRPVRRPSSAPGSRSTAPAGGCSVGAAARRPRPRSASRPAPRPARPPRRSCAGDVGLASLAAGVRGDVLLTVESNASQRDGPPRLQALLQRPGAAFGPPVTLGGFGRSRCRAPSARTAAASSPGPPASRRRPRLVARLLDTDGRFGAGRPLTRTGEPFELGVGVASGAGLPSTVAWTTGRSGNGTVRLRIAALRP